MPNENKNQETEQTTRIVIILPTNAYFMSGIRDFTMEMVKNMTKFDEQWAYRFQSIVDELCNNAIEHGSAQDQDIKVTFTVNPSEWLEVTVEDTGTGKDKLKSKQITESMAKKKDADIRTMGIRGRGLAKIVSQWSDELEFTDRPEGGIKVRMRKYLNKPQEAEKPIQGIGAFNPKDPTKLTLA